MPPGRLIPAPLCSRPQVSARGRLKRLILFNPRTTGRPGRPFPYSPLAHFHHSHPFTSFFQIKGKGRPGRPGRPVLAEFKGSRGCPGRPGIVRSRPQIGNRAAMLSTTVNHSSTPKHWRASRAREACPDFTKLTSEFHWQTRKLAGASCPHTFLARKDPRDGGLVGLPCTADQATPRSCAGDVRPSGQGGWGEIPRRRDRRQRPG